MWGPRYLSGGIPPVVSDNGSGRKERAGWDRPETGHSSADDRALAKPRECSIVAGVKMIRFGCTILSFCIFWMNSKEGTPLFGVAVAFVSGI